MTSGDSKITKLQTGFPSSIQNSNRTKRLFRWTHENRCLLDEALKKLNVGLTVWVTSGGSSLR